MADPDAPQRGKERAGPWLHWIQAGFQGNRVDQGTTQGKQIKIFSLTRNMNCSFDSYLKLTIKDRLRHLVLVLINIYSYYIKQAKKTSLSLLTQSQSVTRRNVNNFN